MKVILVIFTTIMFTCCASESFIYQESSLPKDARELYIDLMKRCLTNTIYEDPDLESQKYDLATRLNGRDWPSIAHTMVGMHRLNNIHDCLKTILEEDIPGDCIETGVWRGGSTILMRAILKAYSDTERKVWVADSFEGLPIPNNEKYPIDSEWLNDRFSVLKISMETVQQNFSKYDLLDKQVVFLKGFFSETLPICSIKNISLLRLDGDLYESTMDALTSLYPKLSLGGFIIIDDYALATCRQAVLDYRELHQISDPLCTIDHDAVYWRKTSEM